ncbi:MAG TPA: bifunctional 4-hydroxy-3-methylbut-2-enyl diphosphate reductase/30S ribosomal protein S1 [Bacillota bacterium]|nr:bifunctional 4-hydroxy-3-methylbut-2-enyl diphosphate reductase/30S ribosomal protein S1 [Bacillota bacterium]
MEVIIAKTAGFCFGVKRALELVEKALENQDSPIYSLGPLIHNPAVVQGLEARGLGPVTDLEGITQGRVVIRSHGVGPSVIKQATDKQLELIDATCPFVKNVQELAMMLKSEGYQVVIVGEREHAEVKGVVDSVGGLALVINEPADLEAVRLQAKVGIVSQTTQDIQSFNRVVGEIIPLTKECRIFNTICLATSQRQQEASRLSREVDVMVVVGGKNSANTRHLAEICSENGTMTYQVESAADLQAEWFVHVGRVGVTAGASTPDAQIVSVIEKINLLGGNGVVDENNVKQNTMVEEVSAETEEGFSYDWPEDRFSELRQGQIIDAKVILVRDDAAFVDIGGKSDLTITLEDISAEPVASVKDVVKVGDVIKVMVTKAGDEDKIRLSKRLYDLEKVWVELDEALEKHSPLEGTVTEVVKGGLSVRVKGLRAFMPASQSGLGATNLEELVGKSFPVTILELDQAKRRLLVSRRALLEEAKKKAEAAFYGTVKEGERKTGKVTRIADFGAFVDLGSGIEGLLHVSEMSWNRIKSPRELLKEGDTVEVVITKIDPDAKKISLSLKQIQAHPWDLASQKFVEEQVYPGKVVKLESFGAFVNLAPGVDGLVHISQISDKRISKPDEVLTVGDEVAVKVLKIDTANRKISLSMKQVETDKDDEKVSEFIEGQNAAPVSQNLGDLLKSE